MVMGTLLSFTVPPPFIPVNGMALRQAVQHFAAHHQILGTQVRVGSQQGLLAGAQAAGLFEKPNWNPGSNDTRLTAEHVRPRAVTWKIAEFLGIVKRELVVRPSVLSS